MIVVYVCVGGEWETMSVCVCIFSVYLEGNGERCDEYKKNKSCRLVVDVELSFKSRVVGTGMQIREIVSFTISFSPQNTRSGLGPRLQVAMNLCEKRVANFDLSWKVMGELEHVEFV